MRAKRSHGMARECDPEYFQDYVSKYPEIHPMFMFITDGYNFRNSEIYAVLGTEQLKRLTDQNIKREENYEKFRNIISKYPDIIKCDLVSEGTSSFCLQFICESEEKRNILEQELKNRGIETRPLCSGNLLRQPFLKGKYDDPENFPNAEYLDINNIDLIEKYKFVLLIISFEGVSKKDLEVVRKFNLIYKNKSIGWLYKEN